MLSQVALPQQQVLLVAVQVSQQRVDGGVDVLQRGHVLPDVALHLEDSGMHLLAVRVQQ